MRSLLVGLACVGLLGVFVVPEAQAFGCKDVRNMVNVGVPYNIVVQVIIDSGAPFDEAALTCLFDAGMPPEVIEAARSVEATPTRLSDRGAAEGSDLGPEPTLEQETSGQLSPVVEEAIERYYTGELWPACQTLQVHAASQNADVAERSEYHLALCLESLSLPLAAEQVYLDSARRGPDNPYFKYAVPKLLHIAERVGDDSEVLRFASQVDPNDYASETKDALSYLMGVRLYELERFADAQTYFGLIGTRSPDYYIRSRFYEGLIYGTDLQTKSTIKSFLDVLQHIEQSAADSERERQTQQRMGELALLNIARTYYAAQRFTEAIDYLQLIPQRSTIVSVSAVEEAWAWYRLGESKKAHTALRAVRTIEPLPSAEILQILLAAEAAETAEVRERIIAFQQRYEPAQRQLESMAEPQPGESPSAHVRRIWQDHTTRLDASEPQAEWLQRLAASPRTDGLHRRLDQLQVEQERLKETPSDLKRYLEQLLVNTRTDAERQLGVNLIEVAVEEAAQLMWSLKYLAVLQASLDSPIVEASPELLNLLIPSEHRMVEQP